MPSRPKVKQTTLQQMFIRAVKETGLNCAQIAREVGTTRQYISELLNGQQHGSLPMWEAILNALDIEIGYRIVKPPVHAPIDEWVLVNGGPEKRWNPPWLG